MPPSTATTHRVGALDGVPDLADTVASEISDASADVTDDAVGPAVHPLLARRPIGVVTSWVMLVCGVLGMAASATLTIERIDLLINPANTPSCNFSPILSCGSVMVTEQARFFGFPNPLLGMPAFAVILTTAVLSVGRVQLPRWYWIGQTLGLSIGFVFVNYLAFQSIYRINALCPYCMVVWTITPILLNLSLSRALGDGPRSRLARDLSWMLLIVWYAIVIVCGGQRFWDYWVTLF
ncbi:vitamin K epoxide reductase family protein [Gordonia sp. (in: high G+C Gram-positive bacteria)]|uniref:vitamin K epoxide reductase family protein n=1 Tax=Gordonia sp. (in: high G+C Gram-positive bacteria) TaxID=84139 RepID=UPI00262286EF|nr:vitamin K epoxide reductase family protein [Gordonia sp. (in: high G+C Gram-positive bacteria)]